MQRQSDRCQVRLLLVGKHSVSLDMEQLRKKKAVAVKMKKRKKKIQEIDGVR